MNLLLRHADNRNYSSLASRLRKKRFEYCRQLILKARRPVTILDVGGRQGSWELMGLAGDPNVTITLINIEPVTISYQNIKSVFGDGRSMPQFKDNQFDFVFSNSVIEHVGGDDDIHKMASEIRRVGKSYYVQTPNRYFPIEPHFLFPFFQFLPVPVRTTLLQHSSLGWVPRVPDRSAAEQVVRSINLLSKKQMRALFPDAETRVERLVGFSKSIQSIRNAVANDQPVATNGQAGQLSVLCTETSRR